MSYSVHCVGYVVVYLPDEVGCTCGVVRRRSTKKISVAEVEPPGAVL